MTLHGWYSYFKDKGKPWDEYVSAEAYRNRFQIEGLTTLAMILAKKR